MAADSSNSTSSNAANIENILSAVQNWAVAQNGLTKSLSAIISSNHVNLNLSNLTTFGFSTTTGTVTTINTSVGLLGGPITVSGTLSVSLTTLTNSISSDHALTNTATYFDGPTVAQGSSGTWFASGTVVVTDTATANINCKLWDGTTVIASANINVASAGGNFSGALSGIITSPAGNIRISCKDINTVNGKIVFNFTGNSKDSTVTAIRIG